MVLHLAFVVNLFLDLLQFASHAVDLVVLSLELHGLGWINFTPELLFEFCQLHVCESLVVPEVDLKNWILRSA
jgi:hypothetical protein